MTLDDFREILKISIHASRGGSDLNGAGNHLDKAISIHASRGGSDSAGRPYYNAALYFNPRFPRGKRRGTKVLIATTSNFNPRFPRGKRHENPGKQHQSASISIHASRGGSDRSYFRQLHRPAGISIHASRGGSDKGLIDLAYRSGISIHASRGGSDPEI